MSDFSLLFEESMPKLICSSFEGKGRALSLRLGLGRMLDVTCFYCTVVHVKVFQWLAVKGMVTLVLRIFFVVGMCHSIIAEPRQIDNFPSVDQGKIQGAEFRCGAIALGSWLFWLSEYEVPELHRVEAVPADNPFIQAPLDSEIRKVLAWVDHACGGTGEIKILRLVECLVEYVHAVKESSLKCFIYYYNLPSEALLRELYSQNAAVVLIHGIYRQDPTSRLLIRNRGHYTCLINQTDHGLVSHTYGKDYPFSLDRLSMSEIVIKDRYRPKGAESLVYLHYPKDAFPRYTFRSYAPEDCEHALKQKHRNLFGFANAQEIILLEGALAFWIGLES